MMRQHLTRDTEHVDLQGHRLLTWHSVQNLILKRASADSARAAFKTNQNGSLEQNFSMAATLSHAEPLFSDDQLCVPGGMILLTHSSSDLRSVNTAWLLDDDFQIRKKAFPITSKLTSLKYLPKHRKIIGCTADMKLKLFSDIVQNCKELCQERLTSMALCIERIPDTEEIIVGGTGFLLNLMVDNDSFKYGRALNLILRPTDVAVKLMVDSANKQLLVLCQHAVFVLHYLKNILTHRFENKHESAMTCCAFYQPLNYFMTASNDGALKVWSSATYHYIREISAHSRAITDIFPNSVEPLLFSSSLDGLIKIWRMDTLELHFKFDVGDAILAMRALSENYVYISCKHEIKIYEYKAPHGYYATTHAQMARLDRVSTSHFPAIILCRAQNGAVFVLNALTGKCRTSITGVKMLEDCKGAIYLRMDEQLFVLMDNDNVAVLDASTHPCTGSFVIESGKEPQERIVSIAHVQRNRAVTNDNGSQQDDLIFAGLKSGEIILLHASRSKMAGVCRGHRVPVAILQSSEACRSINGNKDSVGYCDRLMSVSVDGTLKIWGLSEAELGSEIFTLVCLKMVDLGEPAKTLSVIRGTLAYVTKEESASLKIASLEISQDQQRLRARVASHEFPPPAKHVAREISDLAGCARLSIFCTACNDGSLWVWDDRGTLLRRLQFDETLRGCCFADSKGTILIGVKNHLSVVSIVEYYPMEKLKQLLLEDFEDDEDEDSWKVDVSDTTPPLDVSALRRHAIDRQTLNLPANEDGARESTVNIESPAENPTANKKSRVLRKILLSQKLKKGLSSKLGRSTGSSAEAEMSKDEPSAQGHSAKGAESTSTKANRKHVFTKAEFDAAVTTLQTTKEQLVKEEKRRASLEFIKKMEALKRNKYWPIAPDGIIPNSVVRGILEQTADMLPESERSKLGEMRFMMAKLNLLNLKGIDQTKLESQVSQVKKTRKLIPDKIYAASTQKEITLLSVEYQHAAIAAMQWDATPLPKADLVPIAFENGAFIEVSIADTRTPDINEVLPEPNDTVQSMWSREPLLDQTSGALNDIQASTAFADAAQPASEHDAGETVAIGEPPRAATPEARQGKFLLPHFQERKYKPRLIEYPRRNHVSAAIQPIPTRSVPVSTSDEMAPKAGSGPDSASAAEVAVAANHAENFSSSTAPMEGLLSIKNTRIKQRAERKADDPAGQRRSVQTDKGSAIDGKHDKPNDTRWQTWRQQESSIDRPVLTGSMSIDGGNKVILLKKRAPRPPRRAWDRGHQPANVETSHEAQPITETKRNIQQQDVESSPVFPPGLYTAFKDEVGVYEDSMLLPPIHFPSAGEPSVDFQKAEQSFQESEEKEAELLPLDPSKVLAKGLFDESERYVRDYLRATWFSSPAAPEARFAFPVIPSTMGPGVVANPAAPPLGASAGPGLGKAQDSLWVAVPKLLAGEEVDQSALKHIHADYCDYYKMARKKFQRHLSIYKTQHSMEVAKRMCLSRRDYRRRLFSP